MAIENLRNEIINSIWQAILKSGVDLASIPKEQQNKLVVEVADTVLVKMNQLLEEQVPKPAPEEAEAVQVEGEQVLWEGRPFLSLVERYVITTERLKITHGLLSRSIENFELIRIQDIDYKQGLSERMLGIGDIVIRGRDISQPELTLRNISKPDEVYEILRKAWLEARKRYGLQFREYLSTPT